MPVVHTFPSAVYVIKSLIGVIFKPQSGKKYSESIYKYQVTKKKTERKLSHQKLNSAPIKSKVERERELQFLSLVHSNPVLPAAPLKRSWQGQRGANLRSPIKTCLSQGVSVV